MESSELPAENLPIEGADHNEQEPGKVEVPVSSIDKAFVRIRDEMDIQPGAELSNVSDHYSFELEHMTKGKGMLTICIDETKLLYSFEVEMHMIMRHVRKMAALENCEIGDYRGPPLRDRSGARYLIHEKFIDGKINWRRWLPYPENFSKENKELLDEIASFTELQEQLDTVRGDGFEVFGAFLDIALHRGLIKKEEWHEFRTHYYRVANG